MVRSAFVVMVESHDARGQTVANERGDLLLSSRTAPGTEEFPCSRYLSANLRGCISPRHVLEDVGGHVVGEREHRHE